jgi:hypothetical protein
VPPLLKPEVIRWLPGVLRTFASPGPANYLRAWWGPGVPSADPAARSPVTVAMLLPVLDAACATVPDTRGQCTILASRGLFNPSWEDGGSFALFLAGRPDVTVVTPEVLWMDDGRPSGVTRRVHALVDVACAAHLAPSTGGRFRAQIAKMDALLLTHREAVLGRFGDDRACVQAWYGVEAGGLLVE